MTATADLPNKKLVDFTEKLSFVDGDMSLILDSEDSYILKKINKTLMKGDQWIQGIQWTAGTNWTNWTNGTDWDDGNWIDSISLISTVGKVKTYRILFTDATTYDFTVTDGADGTGSGDMLLSSIQSVTWLKTFDKDKIAMKGTSTGTTVISTANTGATSYTATLPAKDGTVAMTSDADMLLGTVQAVTAEKTFTNDKITLLGSSTGKTILHSDNASGTDYTLSIPAATGTLKLDSMATNKLLGRWTASTGVIEEITLGTNLSLSGTTLNATGGGSSFWTLVPWTPTRTGNTTFTITGDYTTLFKKWMVLKRTESSTIRNAMISIPSTYWAPDTTITIIGDTMASIDSNSLKYAMIWVGEYIIRFAVAGTIWATGTDVSSAYYAVQPMRVIWAELQVWTVASTSGNTVIDINKWGTTMFTTKPTIAYNALTVATPFTADTATSLALADRVTVDVDTVTSTTFPVDLYVQLYLRPDRMNYLT